MPHLTPEEAMGDGERVLAPGTPIGEYEVQELLGEGGFGAVYRALHPVIGKSAAVKVLKREYAAKPDIVARFISEARAVNQIRHKNIVDIFSFGKLDDGRQYFVMELLEGKPLDKVLAQQRIALSVAIPMLQKLARALGAAHASGITHRDIKPENVFVTYDDEGQLVPKLLDFGIAKLRVDNFSQHKTRSGMPMGTPLYMSPEQVHGRAVDHRSDIYSLGIVVFQVVTGTLPFSGETMMDVMMQQVNMEAPPPTSIDPELAAELDAPILRMLEKDPAKRPDSVIEAIDDIARALGMPALGASTRTPNALDGIPQPAPSAAIRLMAKTPAKNPSEQTIAALGASDTLIASDAPKHDDDNGKTIVEGRRSWSVALVAAAALALGCGIAAFVLLGNKREQPAPSVAQESVQSTATVAATPVVTASAPAEATLEVTPALSSSPASAASAAAVPVPSTVKLVVRSNPDKAEVWLDKKKLGLSDEELTLPRGDQELVLNIRKNGYAPKTLKVVPSKDLADAVILVPQARQTEYGQF